MRVLFLSNLYPPATNGGFEQWCQEIADGLHRRGHDVAVLTSQFGLERIPNNEPEWVHRQLYMEMEFASFLINGLRFFTSREAREVHNQECLRQLISDFKPDLCFVWGMWNLSWSLPALAELLLPGRVVYYMADYWPALPSQHQLYWQSPAKNWVTRVPKSLLRPVAQYLLEQENRPTLTFRRALFPSRYLQEEYTKQGIIIQASRVIYGAIDTRPFVQENGSERVRSKNHRLDLLYAGRLAPEKGIPTAIKAIQILVSQREIQDVHLSIAGSGERGYVNYVHELVQREGLEDYVSFLGPVAKEAMPGLYRQFDAFLFTSTWQEPFGRVLVEALASGVAVIGTMTGGATEIMVEGENALTFSPEDSAGLADQIQKLYENPGLISQLAENGRELAISKFDIARMIAEIDEFLQTVVAS